MRKSFTRSGGRLLAGAATLALSMAALGTPANAIVPNDNVTPDEAVDEGDQFSGVGMFYRADGFVCTGTLINPRTVIFAAHCVNDRDASEYNVNNVPAAFSFNVDALQGFRDWITAGFASVPGSAVFNINRIFYNQDSIARPDGLGFLEGDVALASLDTPAANLPTWSLLFSPLPDPNATDANGGEHYHVNITGYGRSGTGTTGASQGIDWRRRSAENMIGALTSFDARNTFLFGDAFGDLPQVLYRLDFDDPNKTNPFDFNLYKDEPLEREGTTAGGDSGGPLILDAANNAITDEDLVIAVLSGGSRFFGPQTFSSYGTESFYQPLFLFWDWIAAYNPYRYVTAKAGDGAWEDATHWETTLDPNYRIIDADGNIVNGVPTSPGAGITGDAPQWGEVCFDQEGDNPGEGCQDLATGEDTPPARNAGGAVSSGLGQVGADMTDALGNGTGTGTAADASVATAIGRGGMGRDMLIMAHESQNGAPDFAQDVAHDGGADFAEDAPHASDGGTPEFSGDPLPDPTIDNGLPGATNFVPDNVDPTVDIDPAVNVDPRYYDVTLGNSGTTTLSSDVTIDRLTVLSGAGLKINSNGNLTSLIDISQFGGTITVNGGLTSVGDYTIFGGALQGTGTVTAPFVTNVMGAISPGTVGGIGTLTIDGSLVQSSAATLMVDIGPNNTSDLLAVTGEAAIDGVVAVGQGITQQVNGNGQVYTILTADGGVTGTFVEGQISAILSQSFTYTDTAVMMEILAASYNTVIASGSPVQSAYAKLWDDNRANSTLASLYALDFADQATIRATFDGLAPVAESAVQTLAAQSLNQLQSFNNSRIRESDLYSTGGTVATIGRPIETAELSVSRSGQPLAANALALDDGETTRVSEGAVREDMAIYLAGGLLQGKGDSMPGYQGTRTDTDGYFFALGAEYFPAENSMFGISGYYSHLDADVVLGQEAKAKMWALSLYGRAKSAGGLVLDGQLGFTDLTIDTLRTVGFLGGSQTLRTSDGNSGYHAALGLSYDLESSFGTISPGIEARYAHTSFDNVQESGGPLALRIAREGFESFQGRAGIDYEKQTANLQVNFNADLVHEFKDGPQAFQANFVQGVGSDVFFLLPDTKRTWGEVGLSAQFGNGPLRFGIGADTTIGRDNANAQSYRATMTYRF